MYEYCDNWTEGNINYLSLGTQNKTFVHMDRAYMTFCSFCFVHLNVI